MSVEEERKLFVAGLSEAITAAALKELFAGAGAVVEEVSIPRDRALGTARGFAFVTLETGEQARGAMEALDGSLQEGRAISVRPFRSERGGPSQGPPRSERGQRSVPPRGGNDDATLYVGNIPFDATPEDVTALFVDSGFDGVRRVHLPTDPEGRKRGFGFVTLADADMATRAAETMEGRELRGRTLSVNLARRGGSSAPGGSLGSVPARPMRPSRPSVGSDDDRRSVAPPPATVRPPPDFPGDAEDRRSGARREKKKDKKRKGRGLAPERGPRRRQHEGFKAPRARGSFDDWEDD